MFIASEEGEYIYKRSSAPFEAEHASHPNSVQLVSVPDPSVCGLYVVADPYKTVEISFNHLDASCESGALLGVINKMVIFLFSNLILIPYSSVLYQFVDGWELNGEYFPGVHDHPLSLEERVSEFCVEDRRYPYRKNKRMFRSSQNAALLQYRIPKQGSFMVSVKFHSNPDRKC